MGGKGRDQYDIPWSVDPRFPIQGEFEFPFHDMHNLFVLVLVLRDGCPRGHLPENEAHGFPMHKFTTETGDELFLGEGLH